MKQPWPDCFCPFVWALPSHLFLFIVGIPSGFATYGHICPNIKVITSSKPILSNSPVCSNLPVYKAQEYGLFFFFLFTISVFYLLICLLSYLFSRLNFFYNTKEFLGLHLRILSNYPFKKKKSVSCSKAYNGSPFSPCQLCFLFLDFVCLCILLCLLASLFSVLHEGALLE